MTATGEPILPRVRAEDLSTALPDAIDAECLAEARTIVDGVRRGGEAALRAYGERFGDLSPGDPLVVAPDALHEALRALPAGDRAVLERTAERIRAFASAQRKALGELSVPVPGGHAGHQVVPVERAGCYAPGGLYPLPSSVLMTAVTARAAGVDTVWVASPRPGPVTLAAAAVAGADALLAIGGAQAIAALAYGAGPVPACDVVVGPGNRYVTAAKRLIAGEVAIDMLAGPSELVVLADETADAGLVAADLLAQAEHDPAARPVLISTSVALIDAVEEELGKQLKDLPTAAVARLALRNGAAIYAADLDGALALCDRLAPEHLQLMLRDAEEAARRPRHFGALFAGPLSGEVLGDYGIGPNHVLPTGGGARRSGGLSVLTFLRVRTWLRIDDAGAARPAIDDAVRMAELEGLAGHARAARRRSPG